MNVGDRVRGDRDGVITDASGDAIAQATYLDQMRGIVPDVGESVGTSMDRTLVIDGIVADLAATTTIAWGKPPSS